MTKVMIEDKELGRKLIKLQEKSKTYLNDFRERWTDEEVWNIIQLYKKYIHESKAEGYE